MRAEEPVAFGPLLRRARLAAGLTQDALAERAGLSVRGVQALERGAHQPQADTVRRLASALGLTGAARAAFARAGAPRPREREDRSTVEPRRAGLPAEVTSFVGREGELAALRPLLSRTRLLTLPLRSSPCWNALQRADLRKCASSRAAICWSIRRAGSMPSRSTLPRRE